MRQVVKNNSILGLQSNHWMAMMPPVISYLHTSIQCIQGAIHHRVMCPAVPLLCTPRRSESRFSLAKIQPVVADYKRRLTTLCNLYHYNYNCSLHEIKKKKGKKIYSFFINEI